MSPAAAHDPILRAEGEIPTGRASILPLEVAGRSSRSPAARCGLVYRLAPRLKLTRDRSGR